MSDQTTGWLWRLYAVVMRRPPEAEDIAWAKREVARIEGPQTVHVAPQTVWEPPSR